MIIYLLKSTTCLALLLAFYHLVLEREKMHNFNRIYLLSSILFSFLAPLYIIYIDVPPIVLQTIETTSEFMISEDYPTEIIIEKSIDYTQVFLGFYAFVSFLLLIRFGKNLVNILNKVRENTKITYQNSKLVLVDDKIQPHTFWNYIFINKEDYRYQKIEQELFTHELTHVTQKHTLDILIIEIIQIVFWINPFFILLKKAMKLNHEFLADDTVINQHKNTFQYQYLLLNKAAWKNDYYLASNLNYSLTKKRLKMMTTQSSQTQILLKKLAVIPLLAGFVFLFAKRVEAREVIKITEDPIQTIVEEDSSIRKVLSNSEMNEYVLLIKKEGVLIIQNQSTNINNLKKVIDAEINNIENAHIILEAAPKANLNYDLVNDIKNELRKSGIYKISFKNFTLSPKPHKVLLKKQTPLKGKLPNDKIVEIIEVLEEAPKKEYIDSPIGTSSKQSVSDVTLKLEDINKLFLKINNPDLEEYNKLAKKYNQIPLQKRIIKLKDLNTLESLYKKLSKEEKMNAQPFPNIYFPNKEIPQQNPKFHKDWFITIDGQKYYYTFDKDERVARYYKNGKLANLDIVEEYKKKHKIFENLKATGKHYVFKPKNEQKEIDREFSDLGGMYFRMPRVDKNKVPYPDNPIKPYVRLKKGDKIWYKKLDELTEEEKLLLPPPPPMPNASEKEILKAKKAYSDWKKRTGNDLPVPPKPTKNK
ncbi:M56 family metallopeptidase [Polaribacter sargassicola]|uniref:M56 family metallopeptidase n=1 Tax=Polaribacter sargassicola TaxID=2836891 RepID=UPI001F2E39DC|nr:M56 family metallopeptidase [Polaribacter sp. DS7-9]MCG1036011.1 hypothetical protein [Polaribacter sp. DS7-9]